jgi:serine/threonine-protein kinase
MQRDTVSISDPGELSVGDRGAASAGAQPQLADTIPAGDREHPVDLANVSHLLLQEGYELLELLGEGAMGAVYKARDRRLGRTVAIKLAHGVDPKLALRFRREAHAQGRIKHRNVCVVHSVGIAAGRPYIVLQLVQGEPLHRAAARMSLDEKLAVLRDAAAGVHEANRLGIVHRDVKPANVVVEQADDGHWVPVVTDFGLAREATA